MTTRPSHVDGTQLDREITRLLAGELDDVEAEALRARLRDDPCLEQRLDELEQVWGTLVRPSESIDDETDSARRVAAVLSRVAAEREAGRSVGRWQGWRTVASAAALLVGVFGGWQLGVQPGSDLPAPQAEVAAGPEAADELPPTSTTSTGAGDDGDSETVDEMDDLNNFSDLEEGFAVITTFDLAASTVAEMLVGVPGSGDDELEELLR